MEAALRENRMTLEAIRVTQSDRDLFKHLISEATNYVAADYMRHANERRIHRIRRWSIAAISSPRVRSWRLSSISTSTWRANCRSITARRAIWKPITGRQRSPELVQTALRQQEKIERYEADLDELQIRLEEQNEVVAEAVDRQEENEARAEAAELEVDELKSQLADYQQALDVQQTRAIQYNRGAAGAGAREGAVPSAGSDPGERRRVAGNLPGERAGSDGENAVAGTENERGANRAQPV